MVDALLALWLAIELILRLYSSSVHNRQTSINRMSCGDLSCLAIGRASSRRSLVRSILCCKVVALIICMTPRNLQIRLLQFWLSKGNQWIITMFTHNNIIWAMRTLHRSACIEAALVVMQLRQMIGSHLMEQITFLYRKFGKSHSFLQTRWHFAVYNRHIW